MVIRREKTVVTMKLDAEDYENIYLRIRSRLVKMVALGAAFVGVTSLASGYALIKTWSEKAVDTYVSTDAFKNEVLTATLRRLEGLEQRSTELGLSVAKHEKLVGNLASLPLSAGPDGLSVVDTSGSKFLLELGEVKAGGSVKFKNAFSKPPLVLMIPVEDRFGRPLGPSLQRTEKDAAVTPMAGVTEEGFTAGHVGAVYRPGRFRWIAIGG